MKNTYLSLVLLMVIALFLPFGMVAQEAMTVVGRVTDKGGAPLVGVTVLVRGTTSGTATDVQGNYSIAASAETVLDFSYLGYTSVFETVGSRTVVSITLAEEATSIGNVEIVSVGYGSVARRDLTGSVAKADLGEVLKSNVTTVDQALAGRVAGVVSTTSDGALGGEASVTIRGGNSLTHSNAPLYVVDGFPLEGALSSMVSPADIESIDILKDASATAIYGARGANGVIVVTTKKGKEGLPKVSFNAGFTVDRISRKADLMGGYDFVKLQSEISPSTMAESYFKDRVLEDYLTLPSKDWQDAIYRTALTQKYDVSLLGGNADTKYSVSFSALDQEGIIVGSGYERYQGRFNFSQNISKKLHLSLNGNYARAVTHGVNPSLMTNSTSSASGWLMYSVWGYRPVTPAGVDISDSLLDEEMSGSNDYRFNPVKTAQNEFRRNVQDNLTANMALSYKITPSLTLRVTGNYGLDKRRQESFNNSNTYTGYAGSPSGMGVNGSILTTDYTNWSNENTLTWKRRFARHHNIDVLGGLSLQGSTKRYDGISATNVRSEELGLAGLYTGDYQVVQGAYDDWRMLSYFMRLNYNFKYRYYLTASMRADGSSKFPTDNRWGYFPSVGASWNFNREEFLKDVHWLSNGKLRLSWGRTGNNRTRTSYDFYKQVSVLPGSSNSVDYVFDGVSVPGYFVSNPGNPALKWETTTQTNVGIDLGLWSDRVKVVADWYRKDTRDLLLYALLPSSSGYKEGMLNVGAIRNTGFEFTLETVNLRTRDFEWRSNFNIAFNRNRVTRLLDNQTTLQSSVSWDARYNSQFPYIAQVGRPAGMMYGYLYEGTYKQDDFDAAGQLLGDIPHLTAYQRSAIRPGDLRYRDMNGDGVIDDHDRTIIGNGQPLHTGGFNNTFTWRNFDLNVFFSWSYGNDILNANRYIFESGGRSGTNQLRSYNDRWTPENPHSDTPRVKAQGEEVYSSRVVEDGSYLRLKNLSLGYTFPTRSLRRVGLGSLRVYLSADNVWTLTNYSGVDPEVSTRNSVLTPGFDWSAYPRTMGVTAGVNVTF